MRAFWANITKETLLLVRDKAGLLFLFFMPIALALLMTGLQDTTIKQLNKKRIDIALINYDKGVVGNAIITGLDSIKIFKVYKEKNNKLIDLETAKKMVDNDEINFVLIIPKGTTKKIKKVISNEVIKQFPTVGAKIIDHKDLPKVKLQMYYNPIIKGAFLQAVSGGVRELIANIQTQLIFKAYNKAIERLTYKENTGYYPHDKIEIIENTFGHNANKILPSSTQHNIPAWTVFAIFFMVIPIASQIVNERTDGTLLRLTTIPTTFFNHLFARVLVYSIVAVLQAVVLLIIGKYLLPILNLPIPEFTGLFFDIILFTIIIGFTAVSYGILIGVVTKSQNQASIFGAVSVVILAAIGGIMFPTYAMSETMRIISSYSPLNWALDGYYDIFLKQLHIIDLFSNIVKLLVFFSFNLLIAVLWEKKVNTIR